MASLSGNLQRPITAAAAVALAAISADKLPTSKISVSPEKQPSIDSITTSEPQFKSWVSLISASELTNMSLATKFRIPTPNVTNLAPTSNVYFTRNSLLGPQSTSILFHPAFLGLRRSAELAKVPSLNEFAQVRISSQPEVMYRWHLPERNASRVSGDSECLSAKSKTVVVLLGWLGSKQKHLRRYADWYTSRGYNVITFTFPMNEILSYKVGGKAEQHVDMLGNHLADWLEEDHGKNLVFHTFSNTGWLTYGAILEKFRKDDPSLLGKIKGCVVDSAPVAAPDPRVWASGFSAAFLKKQSTATKGAVTTNGSGIGVLVGTGMTTESIPAFTETALLVILENFFKVVLNLPKVNRRLCDVMDILSVEQPKCPQLYIYSSADRVIPAESVESFIEKQRKSGREVKACNFVSTPHVDHFRNDPNLYTSQLSNFLEDCVLTCCKDTH